MSVVAVSLKKNEVGAGQEPRAVSVAQAPEGGDGAGGGALEAEGPARAAPRAVGMGRDASGACFQAEDGIRDLTVTGVQTCALPICAVLARVQAFVPWMQATYLIVAQR